MHLGISSWGGGGGGGLACEREDVCYNLKWYITSLG
jgi:hypothetical protein